MPSHCSWKTPSFRTSSEGQCFSPYSPLHGSQRLGLTFCLLDLFVGCQAPRGSSGWDTACLWWCTQQGGARDRGKLRSERQGQRNGSCSSFGFGNGENSGTTPVVRAVTERPRCPSQNCSRGTCAHVDSPSLVYLHWLISDTAQSGPLS